ncbi:MAG: ribonuclease E/G [Bacillota bacterium]|nr:ribonuclease E/G [Bacillota bacterium]
MKEVFIERRDEILRIAVKSGNKLTDCFIEEEEQAAYPGQLYKAVVKNIVPAIRSAFLDIGLEKNAYLYLEGKYEKKNIRKGDELIVEVVKEELGDKGAKVTSAFSLPGRYSVLLTDNTDITFSSKISSREYKESALKGIIKPGEIGIKVRTSAEAVSLEALNKEIGELYDVYRETVNKASYMTKAGLLFSDGGVLARVLRDIVEGTTTDIIVDNELDYGLVKAFIKEKSDIGAEVVQYSGHRSIFDAYGIEKELLFLRNRRVKLGCGGYIVIDRTEAMYVIDVNSGKNVNAGRREDTALTTNLEAAESAARQIRVRNLSGIIVVDFIDMSEEINKRKVLDRLRQAFEDDKNKTIIYPFTELGLVQIARRRRGKALQEFMEEECNECKGRGSRLRFQYICMLIKNEILKVDNENRIKDIYIELNEYYQNSVDESLEEFLRLVEGEDKRIYLKYSNEVESFKVEPLLFKRQIESVMQYKVRNSSFSDD